MGRRIKGTEFRQMLDLIEDGKSDASIMLETGFSVDTVKRARRAKEYIDNNDFEGLRTAYIDGAVTGSIYYLAGDMIIDNPKPEPEQMRLDVSANLLEEPNSEKIELLLEQLVRSNWAIVEMLKKVGDRL